MTETFQKCFKVYKKYFRGDAKMTEFKVFEASNGIVLKNQTKHIQRKKTKEILVFYFVTCTGWKCTIPCDLYKRRKQRTNEQGRSTALALVSYVDAFVRFGLQSNEIGPLETCANLSSIEKRDSSNLVVSSFRDSSSSPYASYSASILTTKENKSINSNVDRLFVAFGNPSKRQAFTQNQGRPRNFLNDVLNFLNHRSTEIHNLNKQSPNIQLSKRKPQRDKIRKTQQEEEEHGDKGFNFGEVLYIFSCIMLRGVSLNTWNSFGGLILDTSSQPHFDKQNDLLITKEEEKTTVYINLQSISFDEGERTSLFVSKITEEIADKEVGRQISDKLMILFSSYNFGLWFIIEVQVRIRNKKTIGAEILLQKNKITLQLSWMRQLARDAEIGIRFSVAAPGLSGSMHGNGLMSLHVEGGSQVQVPRSLMQAFLQQDPNHPGLETVRLPTPPCGSDENGPPQHCREVETELCLNEAREICDLAPTSYGKMGAVQSCSY
ncbi:hypothetical protein WN51_06516 [Melipona quadrifasciata]|uniref:Uncharacterized protein n=1 Tax=Melipona quadrifasciata TaxID=166423 RepID=A0A0M8ZQS2_9HYME|nr:hypothetical protein WN51_06516 [Melipona quadrifasciata]